MGIVETAQVLYHLNVLYFVIISSSSEITINCIDIIYLSRRSDTTSQYWMGAVRDLNDRTVWRWTGSGEEVSVSFWSLPQSTEEDCARYDGSRGWLWSDTPCNARLNFICQHRKCFPLSLCL